MTWLPIKRDDINRGAAKGRVSACGVLALMLPRRLAWTVLVAAAAATTAAQAKNVSPPGVQEQTRQGDAVGEIDPLGTKDSGFVVMSLPIVDPTIGDGLGAVGLWTYNLDPTGSSPPSSTLVAAGYTLSDSWFIGGVQKAHWDRDRYRFDGFLAYADLNLRFFGVGLEGTNDSIEYNLSGLVTQPKMFVRVWPKTYLGDVFSYFGGEVQFESGSQGLVPTIGLDSTTTGIGSIGQRDTRDNTFFPWDGSLAEIKYLRFDDTFGGDFEYNKVEAFYSDYTKLDFGDHRLAKEVVAAFRLDLQFVDGGLTPFWDLPALTLRGFPRTKYIDDKMWQAQGGLRWMFHRRVGLAGFFGLGQVASHFSEFGRFGERDLIYAGGAGVRYRANEEARINAGLDVAFGSKGEEAVYFRIGEAF